VEQFSTFSHTWYHNHITISPLILVNYEFIVHAVLLFESFRYIGRL